MTRRNPVQIDQALSRQALDAAAQRYLGSMIACEDRPSWYPYRTLYEITDESIADPLARNIFRTIAQASSVEGEDFDFSPGAIAYRMIENDSVGKVDDISGAVLALTERLAEIASYGERTEKSFRRVESLFAEKLKFDRAQHVTTAINEIMSARNGKSILDKVDEARQYLDELSGQFVPQTRSANAEQQAEILDQMHVDVLAKIGEKDLTFPPHFGIFSKIIRPKRKEMITISGPSGGGKSILLGLFSEWLARCNYRVLVILTEDDLETVLARAACRHIPGTTMREIDEGDPRGKKEQYKKLLGQWKSTGGEIVYEERPGITGTELRVLIENKLTEAKAQGQPFTAVFIDYFQDIDFDTDAIAFGNNRVAAAGKCAVQLRAIAQKHNVMMVVASQETVYGEDVKTAWSKRLVEKSQVWLRFVTATAKEQVSIRMHHYAKDADENGEVVRSLARPGEQLPFMYLISEKANRGAKGIREIMLRIGAQHMAWAIDFYKAIRQDKKLEWKIPVFEPVNENFFAKQDEMFKIHDAAALETDENGSSVWWKYDPIRKNGNGH